MTSKEIEFGLDTPVYVTVDASGQTISGDVVIRDTLEEAVLADAVGIDSFNIGEHYRTDLMELGQRPRPSSEPMSAVGNEFDLIAVGQDAD